MANLKHGHSDLIDRLGKDAVRNTYGLTRATLYAWRMRGIPHRKRVSFAKLAAMNGMALPADFFEGME